METSWRLSKRCLSPRESLAALRNPCALSGWGRDNALPISALCLLQFCFVRRPSEAAEATAELPRSARQPRLSRFLRLGRRPAAPAPPQEAPPPPPAAPLLAEIPVLEMPPAHAAAPMLITPLSAQPLGGPGGAWGGFGGATVSGDGPHGQGIWLQQQLELTGGAASMRSSISGISLCSDCSVEECGAAGGGSGGDALNAGSRSSSYCLLPRPTSMNVLLAGSSGSGSGSSTATRSSGSDLLHQLMLQAEPGAAASTPPAPVAGDVHLPYPTLPSAEAVVLSMEPRVAPPSQQQQQQQQVYAAVMPRVPQQSAAGGEYTPNPLLQKEQAALLRCAGSSRAGPGPAAALLPPPFCPCPLRLPPAAPPLRRLSTAAGGATPGSIRSGRSPSCCTTCCPAAGRMRRAWAL